MSWTHAICAACYAHEEPGREPVRLKLEHRRAERCCWCGEETFEGIFYRRDPAKTPKCAGHEEGWRPQPN